MNPIVVPTGFLIQASGCRVSILCELCDEWEVDFYCDSLARAAEVACQHSSLCSMNQCDDPE